MKGNRDWVWDGHSVEEERDSVGSNNDDEKYAQMC